MKVYLQGQTVDSKGKYRERQAREYKNYELKSCSYESSSEEEGQVN